MRFENLKQFIDASMVNRMKWLREAATEDVATAMEFDEEFRVEVFRSVGKQGIIALAQSPTGYIDDALERLTSIEFEPYKP